MSSAPLFGSTYCTRIPVSHTVSVWVTRCMHHHRACPCQARRFAVLAHGRFPAMRIAKVLDARIFGINIQSSRSMHPMKSLRCVNMNNVPYLIHEYQHMTQTATVCARLDHSGQDITGVVASCSTVNTDDMLLALYNTSTQTVRIYPKHIHVIQLSPTKTKTYLNDFRGCFINASPSLWVWATTRREPSI